MIEIRTTDDDTIFINFNYQGIPEDLPIETFEIRPAIKRKQEEMEEMEEMEENDEVNADELVELGEAETLEEMKQHDGGN